MSRWRPRHTRKIRRLRRENAKLREKIDGLRHGQETLRKVLSDTFDELDAARAENQRVKRLLAIALVLAVVALIGAVVLAVNIFSI